MSTNKFVTCPNCEQQFDAEDDHCIYLHEVCESFICVCCYKEHIRNGDCPTFLASRLEE